MAQLLRSVEPTIWALRKNAKRKSPAPSLYEHLFGYDPIHVANGQDATDTPKSSAENPQLNILNPETNFMVMEMVAEDDPHDR